jgi:hypothetical protein
MQVCKQGTDRRIVISTAWILVTLNYIFLNIFKLMAEVTPTTAEEVELVNSMATPEMFLVSAIYLEMAMVMILLTRVLKYGINRWANIIIAALHTLGTLASFFVVAPPIFSIFFMVVEVITLLFIVWYAWSWKNNI